MASESIRAKDEAEVRTTRKARTAHPERAHEALTTILRVIPSLPVVGGVEIGVVRSGGTDGCVGRRAGR